MDAVERDVTLATHPADAWRLISDPDELRSWLGTDVDLAPEAGSHGHVVDDDGTHRHLVIDEVTPGERIAWHWWPELLDRDPDSDRSGHDAASGAGHVSRVEITITPVVEGTRVRIVERPLAHIPRSATLSATPPSVCASDGRGRHTPLLAQTRRRVADGAASCVRGRAEVWAHRLMHLELRAFTPVAALV